MAIPRLRLDDTALLIIDVQERLLPTIAGGERMVHNITLLQRMASELGLPALVTEHYPQGLGPTVDPIRRAMADPAGRVEKTRFSACVDVIEEHLQQWRRSTVLICGIEAHVCVLQTVLDLLASGRMCFLVSDAIGSSQPDQIAPAIRRMEAAGAATTGVMSAMYELLGDARHPAANPLFALAKQIK